MFLTFLQCLSDFSVDHPIWTSILTVLITAYICKWIKSKKIKYPPGPMGLPLLGYLPFLGTNEHLELYKLHKVFGDIFSLRLGIRDVVVLSDFKSIKEAYNKEEISARPPNMLSLTDRAGINHLGNMNLKDWKESRRFTLSTLRTLGMGKNKVEEAITEQIQILLDKLSSTTGRTQINLDSFLYPAINHVIISLICGRTVRDDSHFSQQVNVYAKDALEYLHITASAYYMPFMQPFLSMLNPRLKKLTTTIDNMERMLWKEIYKHEEDQEESLPEDFMDYFIKEMKKMKEEKSTFTKGIMNGNSQLLLLAGNDTTMTTIEWVLLLMAQHQDVQERVYQEIVRVLGVETPPSWNDKDQLPYLDAVIAESMRFHTITPMADPHWVTSDTSIGRYDVPKGTVVISNIYAVHMDPELWDKPEEFNPDRFLTSEGKRIKDPEYLIPFSTGKRICPGEKLARVEVFLFVGAIMQRFKILTPSSGLNMETKFDLVLHPASPFVKLVNRL